jgi:hypothetical protein
MALDHQEADRVPMLEIAIGNKLASSILERDVNVFFSGDAIKNLIKMTAEYDESLRDRFITESVIAQVQFSRQMGIDTVPIMPGAYVLNSGNPFGHSGANDNPAVEVKEISPNRWKIIDEFGFWSIVEYKSSSDTAIIADHIIAREGLSALKRMIKTWKDKDYSQLPPIWQKAVDSLYTVEKQEEYNDLYIMGYADILPPILEPWCNQFFEWIITEPRLMHEYLELEAEGWYSVLKAELATGVVDGIFGSMDWCYKGGCLVSPRHFKEFFAPGLKKIVDLVHEHGLKYIKHCDGNVMDILDIMIDYCGIDAYHPVEPTAGMDIAYLKKKYGKRITLCGNIDCGEMVNWTPEEVKSEVKRIIKTASPGGGHLLSTSNALHSGIPVENARAYVEAANEFGRYPININ